MDKTVADYKAEIRQIKQLMKEKAVVDAKNAAAQAAYDKES